MNYNIVMIENSIGTYHDTITVTFFRYIRGEHIIKIRSDSRVFLSTEITMEIKTQQRLKSKAVDMLSYLSVVRKTFPMFMITFGSCLSR